jgi:transcriptional regulator with XRE-family HTH domain
VAESAFGVVLRELREARQLSLRDLGALAEVDHAYIAKIERGDKEPPPEETFTRLVRHLKATTHQVTVLRFLRTNNAIDPALARHALTNTEATPDILAIAATVVHRGAARPSPADLIERARRAKRIMDGQ